MFLRLWSSLGISFGTDPKTLKFAFKANSYMLLTAGAGCKLLTAGAGCKLLTAGADCWCWLQAADCWC